MDVLTPCRTVGNDGDASWHTEKTALQQAITAYPDQVYGLTIGSEGLYRNTEPASDDAGPGYDATSLTRWVTDAMTTWPNITIGTADTGSSYTSGAADPLIRAGPGLL